MAWIEPDWPVPSHVRACSTTRIGGVSVGAYEGLNLGDHVGDAPTAVARNRELLRKRLKLPGEPHWLRQVHGCAVADAARNGPECEADAIVTRRPSQVCAVLTADCLPLLIADRTGTGVAAVHAGWRGLLGGVVESAVARLGVHPGSLSCWLGPAIGREAFEVGAEVRDAFLKQAGGDAESGFKPSRDGKWLADLYFLARQRLAAMGVEQVFGGGFCTFTDERRFYSYRRDGVTGRMASLIWMDAGSRGQADFRASGGSA